VLQALHLAHSTGIPFENLDIFLGQPIRLDLESLQSKLVRGGRGGYCFEQNMLFAAVLERLGFHVTRLAARNRFRVRRVLPRTHMLLMVRAEGRSWLADVGFGGGGLLLPVPMVPGEPARQFAWTCRIDLEGDLRVLRMRQGETWQDLYVFSLEPQLPIDFEIASYWVSTHPESRFTRTLTVQRPSPEARTMLVNGELTIDRGEEIQIRAVEEPALLPLLRDTFGLAFSPETRFRSPITGEALW
jgi:N-hydroxyarylamine O-acetyltransferase